MQTDVLNPADAVGVAAEMFGGLRTIQIHPTLQCNLTCRHCYSFSSPMAKNGLGLEPLQIFLRAAYAQGFRAVSLSGGEPLLYKDLEPLLSFTKSLGYINAMVSNGMLFRSAKARRLFSLLDLVAISIDGRPDFHDFMRGQVGAFDRMMKGIAILRQENQAFGFIHTLTQQNWDGLLWLADLAYESGAKLLQLHPIESAGRAVEQCSDSSLEERTLHKIFILANYLKTKYGDTMEVQLDLLHRDYIASVPQAFGVPTDNTAPSSSLTDMITNLVVDEQGDITPISYGISKKFCLGNIYRDAHRDVFGDFFQTKGPLLRTLITQTFRRVTEELPGEMVNWSEHLVNESHHVEFEDISA